MRVQCLSWAELCPSQSVQGRHEVSCCSFWPVWCSQRKSWSAKLFLSLYKHTFKGMGSQTLLCLRPCPGSLWQSTSLCMRPLREKDTELPDWNSRPEFARCSNIYDNNNANVQPSPVLHTEHNILIFTYPLSLISSLPLLQLISQTTCSGAIRIGTPPSSFRCCLTLCWPVSGLCLLQYSDLRWVQTIRLYILKSPMWHSARGISAHEQHLLRT